MEFNEKFKTYSNTDLLRIIENKAKTIGKSIFDNVNPIQKEPPAAEKIIRIISIIFGGIFLFQLYKEFGIISFLFTQGDFDSALFFFSLVIIPIIITILFFMRKKIGWLLLAMFLTYSAFSTIGQFIWAIKRELSEESILNNFFPQPSPAIPIFSFIFFAGTIWAISRENIRSVYSISKQTMILTIAITITALIVGIFLIMTLC